MGKRKIKIKKRKVKTKKRKVKTKKRKKQKGGMDSSDIQFEMGEILKELDLLNTKLMKCNERPNFGQQMNNDMLIDFQKLLERNKLLEKQAQDVVNNKELEAELKRTKYSLNQLEERFKQEDSEAKQEEAAMHDRETERRKPINEKWAKQAEERAATAAAAKEAATAVAIKEAATAVAAKEAAAEEETAAPSGQTPAYSKIDVRVIGKWSTVVNKIIGLEDEQKYEETELKEATAGVRMAEIALEAAMKTSKTNPRTRAISDKRQELDDAERRLTQAMTVQKTEGYYETALIELEGEKIQIEQTQIEQTQIPLFQNKSKVVEILIENYKAETVKNLLEYLELDTSMYKNYVKILNQKEKEEKDKEQEDKDNEEERLLDLEMEKVGEDVEEMEKNKQWELKQAAKLAADKQWELEQAANLAAVKQWNLKRLADIELARRKAATAAAAEAAVEKAAKEKVVRKKAAKKKPPKKRGAEKPIWKSGGKKSKKRKTNRKKRKTNRKKRKTNRKK